MSEQLKPKKEKRLDGEKPLIYTESLMEIFNFNRDALMMNERGFVTNGQKQKITDALQDEADSMWLMITILLGVSVLLALIFSFQGYAPLPLVIGAGLVILPILYMGWQRQSTLKQDNDRLRTYRVEGLPQVMPTLSSDKQAILEVADQRLPLSYQQAAALMEFELPPMRFYYAVNSKQILSAEVLDAPDIQKLKNDELLDDDSLDFVDERQLDDEQLTLRK